MKFGPIPLDQAEGKILAHNIAHRSRPGTLRKGKTIDAADVSVLASEGYSAVYAVELEEDDVDEDHAARRVAEAAAAGCCGLVIQGPSDGRVNLAAAVSGVLRVDPARLEQVNRCEGVTFATLRSYRLVRPGQVVATIKIIPYALPVGVLERAEQAARGDAPLLWVSELKARAVGLLLSGLPAAAGRVVRSFEAPLRKRIESWGSQLMQVDYVALNGNRDEVDLAAALCQQIERGCELVVLAGETSIMDRNDVAPRAVIQAGGQVLSVGAPVEPGNLLMLAQLEGVPVVGLPGCARSPKENVVDWVLPVLLAGDPLDAVDVAGMGYGGLMEDDPQEPG
jgi:molybdenum cofactor cytidylyltransferase